MLESKNEGKALKLEVLVEHGFCFGAILVENASFLYIVTPIK